MKREQLNRLAEEIKAQLASIIDDEIADITMAMETAQAAYGGAGRFVYRFGFTTGLEPLERSVIVECKASWATKRQADRSGQVELEPDMLTNVE